MSSTFDERMGSLQSSSSCPPNEAASRSRMCQHDVYPIFIRNIFQELVWSSVSYLLLTGMECSDVFADFYGIFFLVQVEVLDFTKPVFSRPSSSHRGRVFLEWQNGTLLCSTFATEEVTVTEGYSKRSRSDIGATFSSWPINDLLDSLDSCVERYCSPLDLGASFRPSANRQLLES